MIGALASIRLILFLLSQLFRLIKLFIRIMRIVLLVCHGVVDINTLMIKKLSKGYHGSILEIFTKAPCY